TIIKVLNDGTIIPLSAGVAYVKLVPMSGELSNNYIIVVRVSNGDSWETAFKIYDEDDLKAIGEYKDIYNTMTKYYELANDIYLTSKFAPLGIFDDEVVQFSGGIRGASEFSSKVYKIYNFKMSAKAVTVEGTTKTYAGLIGKLVGEVKELDIVVSEFDVSLINSGEAYVGVIAGTAETGAKISGVKVTIEKSNIYVAQPSYIGGIVGVNYGSVTDEVKVVTNKETSESEDVRIAVQVDGVLDIETIANLSVGGVVGVNGQTAKVECGFDYFAETNNFNNTNDNIKCEIKVVSTALDLLGNVGGVAGLNSGEIKKISSVAKIDANIENVGGIAGLNNGKIEKCYFVGEIKNGANVGGIAGKVDVLVNSNNCIEAQIIECMTEILDTTVSKETLITDSRIQGTQNVGGLVGYADFTVASVNHKYASGYSLIKNSFTRSYLPVNAYSDLKLQGENGNIGGLVGYGKNVNIIESYAVVNLNIDKLVEDLNVGGLVGKLENVAFTARNAMGTLTFTNNVKVEDCFTNGTIILKASEEVDLSVGQLIGHLDLGENSSSLQGITNRVYTAVRSMVNYNPMVTFGLVGETENVMGNFSAMFSESYYLYTLEGESSYSIGKAVNMLSLQDAKNTFSEWENYNTTWKVLTGSNDDLMLIYVMVGSEMRPLYTITPTDIDLNIREYTESSQLFTRVDSLSGTTEEGTGDDISKSAILYIYEGQSNEYAIEKLVKILTVPVNLNNARYMVISDNEDIVKVDGDKIIAVGEGTAIITICSAYNKESVYDCIQLAVVYHNFEMRFMDSLLNEYTEEDTVRISKNGSEQVIVYISNDSSVSGVMVKGDIKSEDENALTVNGKILGSNLPFNTSGTSVYSNSLSIKENDYYKETTNIVLHAIPYFNVSLYTNPTIPTPETLATKTIYNVEDEKILNLLIYVGATEVSFNTNNVSSSIGTEISVTVTLKTDYEEDTLLVFMDDKLVMSDDKEDKTIESEDFVVTYFASSKNVAKYTDKFGNEVFSGYIPYQFNVNASDKYLTGYSDVDAEILYKTIESSVVFAGKSSLVNGNSQEVSDYPVKNTFNFKITPAIVSSINIQNFAAGRTVSGKYDPSEDPSYSIVPGEVGLIDILITPMYAGITKLTLENAPTNFTKVSLLQVLQETETGLYVQSNHLIKNTENGIELICKSNINGDGKT
ncbi:MAG: hypothetical protein IJW82_07970, partial [Clostridia bacterium]|nr:hypothetical protein [Clostridia bacterium]